MKPSGIRRLHTKAPGSNPEDCSRVMCSRRRGLGAGVEGGRRPDVLVAEEEPYHLGLPRIAIEIDLGRRMSKPMRGHVEPRVGMDQLFDLAAEGPLAFMLVDQFAGEQEWARSGKQQR